MRASVGRKRWIVIAVVVLSTCLARAEVVGESPCNELSWQGAARRSVVIMISDTMRRDIMGAYGGSARTPAFDAFARDSLVFDESYTEAPRTKAAIAGLFTSLYPSQHDVLGTPTLLKEAENQGRKYLYTDSPSPGFTTLAEVFRDAGYHTAAIVSNPWLTAELGYAQGFETYDDTGAHWSQPGLEISERALRWLEKLPPGKPYLLYLHYMDAHRPHPPLSLTEIGANKAVLSADSRPVEPRVARAIRRLVRLEEADLSTLGVAPNLALAEFAYSKGVEHFDRAMAHFLKGLSAIPGGGDAAIIVTSDHGEALFERGWGNHGRGLHDDETAIPLLARLPGVSAVGARVSCQTSLIDILPTLCTYLGIQCPDSVSGVSWLRPTADGDPRPPRRFIVSEGVANEPRHRAIRNRDYKLLFQPGRRPDRRQQPNPYSLYHIRSDPDEERDLLETRDLDPKTRDVFDSLSSQLREAVPPYSRPDPTPVRLDKQIEERLRSLGYLEAPES